MKIIGIYCSIIFFITRHSKSVILQLFLSAITRTVLSLSLSPALSLFLSPFRLATLRGGSIICVGVEAGNFYS